MESQILFQELNGAVVKVQNYLLKFTPQQLQVNLPVLNNSVFAEVFKTGQEMLKHPEAIC